MASAGAGVPPVIAIDGPGGAGKGTISRLVARRLGFHLLDSGALYRLVALAALERDIPLQDAAALAQIASRLDAHFGSGDDAGIRLAGRNVTEAIRAEACSQGASVVAAVPAVRQALIGRQRAFRRWPGLVADGRDMGTAIFPDASLKVYLTASIGERARRRYKQLKDKGIDVSLSLLSQDMAERDRRDAERAVSPLQPGDEARLLDTTGMEIPEVVATVLGWAAESGLVPAGENQNF